MKYKIGDIVYMVIVLGIVILLFTIIDHFLHSLQDTWSVPEYYFRNKIPFGFLWGILGMYLIRKNKNIWIKAGSVGAIISSTLQIRYLFEGYDLGFVFIFLLFHFLILYFLLVPMFYILKRTI